MDLHNMDRRWTLPELIAEATSVLAADRAPEGRGRARDLPNERTVRWYVTVGLVDPPLSRRGRVALYGPRHLFQLVAIKRRQADGHTIAEIQAELAGATDDTLREIALLDRTAPPRRFWAERPASPDTPSAPKTHDARETRAASVHLVPPARPARPLPAAPGERTGRPASATPAGGPAPAPPVRRGHATPSAPAGRPTAANRASAADDLVHGLRLAPGVTLLLEAPLSSDDAAAILSAAGPLLDTLSERGFLCR